MGGFCHPLKQKPGETGPFQLTIERAEEAYQKAVNEVGKGI